MEPQIYMSSGVRQLFLARHDFYMEQVKLRVLRNFDQMEKDADRVADEIFDRLGSEYSEDGDMAAAAENAHEHGLEFYMLLSNMKTQTSLGAMASLYHQWDKDFRDFMEHELSHAYDRDQVTKYVWQSDINKLFDTVEEFGWPIRQAQWFKLLNACRLIVNVYKHGKGRSFDELARDYPRYLKGPLDDIAEASFLTTPDHEDLSITGEEFDQIACAMRQFWIDFPERSFLISK